MIDAPRALVPCQPPGPSLQTPSRLIPRWNLAPGSRLLRNTFYPVVFKRVLGNLFGDDSQSYADALQRHYEQGAPPDWQQRYVSAFATNCPQWLSQQSSMRRLTLLRPDTENRRAP